ncbi:MAG TPA: tripartite tricarboxylate transporter substrate-binding protein [Beijerinckiaceae bacterium]|nr:tripartite tricarboxylate transporter substrate-binding protein [Beijerinckiaceae bacterium]
MSRPATVALIGVFILLAVQGWGAPAALGQQLFTWKELRIDIPSTPGGGGGSYDGYVRALGRHITKYLPGHPSFVAVNRPGAGGITSANYLYNEAPKDGSYIGMLQRGVPADRMLRGDASNAKFDAEKFNWIGSMNKELTVFLMWQQPPVTIKDLQSGRQISVPATGSGSDADLYARMTAAILGAKIKVILGYPGSDQMYLAMEGKEVNGIAAISWAGLKVDKADWLKNGKASPILVQGLARDRELPGVPALGEFAKTDLDRKLIEFITFRQQIGRPLVTPPGVPMDRIEILRNAFDAAMRDPDMVEEARHLGMEINWLPGNVVAKGVERMNRASPDVIARIRELFGP